jgi:hypothetical protein
MLGQIKRRNNMKISQENIEDLTNIAAVIESLAPLVIGVVSRSMGEAKPGLDAVGDWLNERRVKHLKAYTDAGYSKDQAIQLVLGLANARMEKVGKALNDAAAKVRHKA